MDKALKVGAEIRTSCEVKSIDFDATEVTLESGETLKGDVIIGADGMQYPGQICGTWLYQVQVLYWSISGIGLWSTIRGQDLQPAPEPFETGDVVYRGTFPRETLQALNDPQVNDFCKTQAVTIWAGPEKHGVFYPLRGGEEYNLVLLGPDDLPAGTRTAAGNLEEMKQAFQGWDSVNWIPFICFLDNVAPFFIQKALSYGLMYWPGVQNYQNHILLLVCLEMEVIPPWRSTCRVVTGGRCERNVGRLVFICILIGKVLVSQDEIGLAHTWHSGGGVACAHRHEGS